MCNPGVALGLQGAGALTSAIGARASAKSNQGMLNAQANIDDINARQAEDTAQTVLMAGQRTVQRSQMSTAALKARQKVNMAANGGDLGVGSNAEILTSTDIEGEIDAGTLAVNAVRDAWGYRTQATNYSNAARLKRAGANAINPNGAFTTSLMGSAGSVAKGWYDMSSKAGVEPDYSAFKSRPGGNGR